MAEGPSIVAREVAYFQERVGGPLLLGITGEGQGYSLSSLSRELGDAQVELRMLEGTQDPMGSIEAALSESGLPCGLLLRVTEERVGLTPVGDCSNGAAATSVEEEQDAPSPGSTGLAPAQPPVQASPVQDLPPQNPPSSENQPLEAPREEVDLTMRRARRLYRSGTVLGFVSFSLPGLGYLAAISYERRARGDDSLNAFFMLIGGSVALTPITTTAGAALSTRGLHIMGVESPRAPLYAALSGLAVCSLIWLADPDFWNATAKYFVTMPMFASNMGVALAGATTQLVLNAVRARKAERELLSVNVLPSYQVGGGVGLALVVAQKVP